MTCTHAWQWLIGRTLIVTSFLLKLNVETQKTCRNSILGAFIKNILNLTRLIKPTSVKLGNAQDFIERSWDESKHFLYTKHFGEIF